MEITISIEEGRIPVTVFHVKGNVDSTNYEQLQTKFKQAIDAGTRNAILDLSGVPYMSSVGLRVINQVFNWLRAHTPAESDSAMSKGVVAGTFKSPHLKIVNPTAHVLEVLKTAGVDMYIEIQHDLKSAIATFG